MDIGTTATFTLAFLVFAASPGPDNLTVVSKTVNDGPAHGIAYGCGVVASIAGFVILAALGLNALAGAAGDHLRVVRYLGAAYLVYTGIAMWRAPVVVAPRRLRGGLARLFGLSRIAWGNPRNPASLLREIEQDRVDLATQSCLGFLLNASNPKMPVFYLALLPGVLGTRPLTAADTLTLLAVIVAVEALVIGAHVGLALRARAALARPRRLRALNRGAGAMMVGAGVLVASR